MYIDREIQTNGENGIMSTCLRWAWLIASCIVIFAVEQAGAADDPSNYQRLQVDNRVSIALPREWIIADDNVRRTVSDFADAWGAKGLLDTIPMTMALAADSPSPTRATVRVLYFPTPGLGQSSEQAAIEDALKEDRDQMIAGLREAWQPEMRALARGFSQQGIQILDHGPANIESMDGSHAFTYTYRHTDFVEKSASWRVKQYHIPLGDEKVVMTFSYRESDSGVYETIIDKIKNSVEIQRRE